MAKTSTSFKPGKSGNPAGRPIGAKDKFPAERIRENLLKFLDDNITGTGLQNVYDKLSANDKIKLLALAFKYTMTLPFDPDNLSIENLEQIIKFLRNGQQEKSIMGSN